MGAAEFEAVHNVERALRAGSVHQIIPAAELRLRIIAAVERAMARMSNASAAEPVGQVRAGNVPTCGPQSSRTGDDEAQQLQIRNDHRTYLYRGPKLDNGDSTRPRARDWVASERACPEFQDDPTVRTGVLRQGPSRRQLPGELM